jgi:hypothetical protein
MHDQLGDHRIVVHRDFAAVVDAGIDTDMARIFLRRRNLTRRPVDGRKPRNGSSALIRHSIAQPSIFTSAWVSGSFLAVGHANHLLDQVESGDQFGDRVFDLQRVFISRK